MREKANANKRFAKKLHGANLCCLRCWNDSKILIFFNCRRRRRMWKFRGKEKQALVKEEKKVEIPAEKEKPVKQIAANVSLDDDNLTHAHMSL